MGRTRSERRTTVRVSERERKFSTRQASLALWRGQPLLPAAPADPAVSFSGEPLPAGWTKAVTDDGTPYYLNHATRETQWTDPRLETALAEISVHDEIKFAAYRTAAKLRDLQVFCRVSSVTVSNVMNAIYALELDSASPGAELTAEEMAMVLLEIFSKKSNPYSHVDVFVSWMLKIFDVERIGTVDLQEFKIGISALSCGWLEEKFRYAFGVLDTDSDGFISIPQVTKYLRAMMKVVRSIDEAWAFGPTDPDLAKAIGQCFATQQKLGGPAAERRDSVSLEAFVHWLMAEPRPVVWLSTLHRLAATENTKHEAFCKMCKTNPIIGFRYKCMQCMDADICQDCFWTGREARGHKVTHKVREYCFQTTTKQDTADFGAKIKHRLRSAFGSKKKKEQPAEAEPVPIDAAQMRQPQEQRQQRQLPAVPAGDDPTAQLTWPAGQTALDDEHDEIGLLTAKIAAMGDNAANPMSTMVISLDAEQKMHLLRVIDELDSENRNLLRQLMDARDEASVAAQTGQAELVESKAVLERRVAELNERNQSLLTQLERLRSMLAGTDVGEVAARQAEELQRRADQQRAELLRAEEAKVEVATAQVQQNTLDLSSRLSAWETQLEQRSAANPAAGGEMESELLNLTTALETAFNIVAARSDASAAAAAGRDTAQLADNPMFADVLRAAQFVSDALGTYVHGIIETGVADPQTAAENLSGFLLQSRGGPEGLSAETRQVMMDDTADGLAARERELAESQRRYHDRQAVLRDEIRQLSAQLNRLSGSHTPMEQSVLSNLESSIVAGSSGAAAADVHGSTGAAAAAAAAASTSPPAAGGAAHERKGRTVDEILREMEESQGPRENLAEAPSRLRHIDAEELKATKAAASPAEKAPPPGFGMFESRENKKFTESRESMEQKIMIARMLKLKASIEAALNMTLRDIDESNVVEALMAKLSNGYLLCKLVNQKLAERDLPDVHPNRPRHGQAPSVIQRMENMDMFIRGLNRLNMPAARIPTTAELMAMSESGSRRPSVANHVTRSKATQIADMLETLLAM